MTLSNHSLQMYTITVWKCFRTWLLVRKSCKVHNIMKLCYLHCWYCSFIKTWKRSMTLSCPAQENCSCIITWNCTNMHNGWLSCFSSQQVRTHSPSNSSHDFAMHQSHYHGKSNQVDNFRTVYYRQRYTQDNCRYKNIGCRRYIGH